MKNIDQIGKTAFLMSYVKKRIIDGLPENNPVFQAPHVELFALEEMSVPVEQILSFFPSFFPMFQYRLGFFNETMEKEIAGGKKQVLLLGGGFDTRPILHKEKGIKFFEIDKPPVLEHKKEVLADAGISSPSVYVGCDYLQEDFLSALSQAGLDFSLPTYIIWEGNTMYLPKELCLGVFRKIEAAFSQFSLSFDYFSEKIVSLQTGNQELTENMEKIRKMGFPMITGFDEAKDVANQIGLDVEEDYQTSDLLQRYEPDKPIIDFYYHYRFCTLKKTKG